MPITMRIVTGTSWMNLTCKMSKRKTNRKPKWRTFLIYKMRRKSKGNPTSKSEAWRAPFISITKD